MNVITSINLKGIVIAAEWGPDGDVSAVDIAGYDEKRYRVANDPKGLQLRQLIKQTVRVNGRLVVEDRRNIIHVVRFRLDADEPAPADLE